MKSESDAHDIYNKAWDLPLNINVGIYATMKEKHHYFMLITIDLQAKSCENTLRMLKKGNEATRTFDKKKSRLNFRERLFFQCWCCCRFHFLRATIKKFSHLAVNDGYDTVWSWSCNDPYLLALALFYSFIHSLMMRRPRAQLFRFSDALKLHHLIIQAFACKAAHLSISCTRIQCEFFQWNCALETGHENCVHLDPTRSTIFIIKFELNFFKWNRPSGGARMSGL